MRTFKLRKNRDLTGWREHLEDEDFETVNTIFDIMAMKQYIWIKARKAFDDEIASLEKD